MSEHITVLLVEDQPADVLVVREAFQLIDPMIGLQIVGDGQAALDYLSAKGHYKDRNRFPLPRLILLDLVLPVLDGFHVLEWVRTEPTLRLLPIVILATSSYSPEVKRAYAFGANSFITKPQSLSKLVNDLRLALQYWLLPSDPTTAKPALQLPEAA